MSAGAHAAVLEFLGTRIEIESDDLEVLAGLVSVYASVARDRVIHRKLAVRLRRTGPASADLLLGDEAVGGRGDSPRAAGAAVAFALFHEVAALVSDALVVHAGAVDLGPGAILLVAPSRTGKTTLTTALSVRGAAFLSDEAAPIGRSDRLVRPFPRAIGLRPGPLRSWKELEGAFAHAARVYERGGRGKEIVDLVAAGAVRPGGAVAVRHVVFLLPSAEPWNAAARGRWILDLDARSPGLAERLRAVPGTQLVEEIGPEEEPALRLVIRPGTRIAEVIDAAARAEGRRIVRALEEYPEPDHLAEPELRRLSGSEGVIRLARFLENGARSELFRGEMGGRAGRLVFELGGLVAQARHWELTPGDLEARCRLVEALG